VLREEGVRLWHELVRLLEPEVIVASVARRRLGEIRFEWDGGWRTVHNVDRQNPYVIETRKVSFGASKAATLVFGRPRKPFATISSVDKRQAGAAILQHHAG
jgi:hypothetical protein